MKNLLKSFVLLAVCAVALTGCGPIVTEHVTYDETNLDLSGCTGITVDLDNESLVVKPSKNGQLVVDVEFSGNYRDALNVNVTNSGILMINVDRGVSWSNLAFWKNVCKITVYLPQNIGATKYDIKLSAYNGYIEAVDFVCKSLKVDVVNGEAKVHDVKVNSDADMELSVTNGKIDFKYDDPICYPLDVQVANGSVVLSLDKNSVFEMTCSVGNGSVEYDKYYFARDKFGAIVNKGYTANPIKMKARVGDGKLVINAN